MIKCCYELLILVSLSDEADYLKVLNTTCMYVCMFTLEARTIGGTGLKFGTELGFYPGRF